MTPAPLAPAPSPPRRFPVRQKQLAERLSLPGLLHALHGHPDLLEDERESVQRIRAKVSRRLLVIDVQPVAECLGSGA